MLDSSRIDSHPPKVLLRMPRCAPRGWSGKRPRVCLPPFSAAMLAAPSPKLKSCANLRLGAWPQASGAGRALPQGASRAPPKRRNGVCCKPSTRTLRP